MLTKVVSLECSLPGEVVCLKAGAGNCLSVAPVGGFPFRLILQGQNLWHFNNREVYAAAAGQPVHFGAPFICPPGENKGYDRHGPFRKTVWKVQHSDNTSALLTAAVPKLGLEIEQRYRLYPHAMWLQAVAHNFSFEPEPCEMGLHYYWDMLPDEIDFGDQLIGKKARNNITGESIEETTKELLNANGDIDLHITTGNERLVFFNRARKLLIELSLITEAPWNTTWVLYRKKGDPFYAIEAWSAPAGTVNDLSKQGIIIPPDQAYLYDFTVKVQPAERLP